MENKRVELGEEVLEDINGGQIVFDWDGTNGKIWVTSQRPNNKVYSFTNYAVTDTVTILQNQNYDDFYILELLEEKGYIKEIK